jgi:hypothetical protein
MQKFWSTEDGKAFSHAIHEHNSAIGMIKNHNLFFERHRNDPKVLTEERIASMIESNKRNTQKAFEAMDFLYKHFKDKFEANKNE